MNGTYIPNQKFDLMRILLLHDIAEVWNGNQLRQRCQKHNNNEEKLLTNL